MANGVIDKIKEFVSPIDEDEVIEVVQEDNEEEIVEEDVTISKYEKAKSKATSSVSEETKMVLFEPRAFSDVKEVANRLKEEKAAVINLHRLDRISARRTSDFLSGVMKALDGTIQRIGTLVLLCTPNSIQVKGKINVDGKDEE